MAKDERDPLSGSAYRTLRVIGRGGMGEVVEAEHKALGKVFVVKLLHEAIANPQLAERMRVEAQATAKLSHPNIVNVTDMGVTPAGRSFIVMERLTGRTLAEEVKQRGALPPEEAVGHVLDVLDALAYAHSAGIVHRDVKGENVFLHNTSQGETTVKLLDFGVAKVLSGSADLMPSRFPTEEGTLMGTPRFCSPEQALARSDVDHRADLYGVGVMLFSLVTGRKVFEHKTIVELLRAHAHEAPPRPSSVSSRALPEGLDEVILRALAKQPSDRYQSAVLMANALYVFGPGERDSARRSPPPARGTVRMAHVAADEVQASQRPSRRPRQVTDMMPDPAKPVEDANPFPVPSKVRQVDTPPMPTLAMRPRTKSVPRPFRFAVVFSLALLALAAFGLFLFRMFVRDGTTPRPVTTAPG